VGDTATICIGNSDDKLTQAQWSDYVAQVQALLYSRNYHIHFHGCSDGAAPWQNACWVVALNPDNLYDTSERYRVLRSRLARLAREFNQDSIALTIGNAELVGK
jgi:hypothetical protein